MNNVTPADLYLGRAADILAERDRIKRLTLANRRLQHPLQAAYLSTQTEQGLAYGIAQLVPVGLTTDTKTGTISASPA